MRSFLDYIQFKYIPCDVLVKEVYPLRWDSTTLLTELKEFCSIGSPLNCTSTYNNSYIFGTIKKDLKKMFVAKLLTSTKANQEIIIGPIKMILFSYWYKCNYLLVLLVQIQLSSCLIGPNTIILLSYWSTIIILYSN